MKKKHLWFLTTLLLLLSLLLLTACDSKTASTREEGYLAVAGFGEGYVAVGTGGKAAAINMEGEAAPLSVNTEADLLCITRWQDGLAIGGANGTLLKMDASYGVESEKLGSSDIIDVAVYQNKLYAIALDGVLYESADGANWDKTDTGLRDVVGMAASDSCLMAASADSNQYILTSEGSRLNNYNEEYEDLTPSVTVRGIDSDGSLIWMIGQKKDDGSALAMHTTTGELWMDRTMMILDEGMSVMDVNPQPFAMVQDETSGNWVLLCDGGSVMLLTDCSECNEYYEIGGADALTDAAWSNDHICIVGTNDFIYIVDSIYM